jgi:hypothetical protein
MTRWKKIGRFKKLKLDDYLHNWEERKIVERWTENIVNALIDIAKIVLASEKKKCQKVTAMLYITLVFCWIKGKLKEHKWGQLYFSLTICITVPNLPFHILNRGNRQIVFREGEDFVYFLNS